MDPELKTLLNALAEGQIKLAESQAVLVHGQKQMQKDMVEVRRELVEVRRELVEVRKETTELRKDSNELRKELRTEIRAVKDATNRMSERLDWFGGQIVRGFTSGVSRDESLDRRVTKLERELAAFKKRPPRRPRKKH
ncbi:MAG: hypothetical protein IT381_27475 [Deltaproteobacteria bacterium]|nr:hypothetical protein [Deltaproteobacteria bacterium]